MTNVYHLYWSMISFIVKTCVVKNFGKMCLVEKTLVYSVLIQRKEIKVKNLVTRTLACRLIINFKFGKVFLPPKFTI